MLLFTDFSLVTPNIYTNFFITMQFEDWRVFRLQNYPGENYNMGVSDRMYKNVLTWFGKNVTKLLITFFSETLNAKTWICCRGDIVTQISVFIHVVCRLLEAFSALS